MFKSAHQFMRTITMDYDYEDLQELNDEGGDAILLSDEEIHEAADFEVEKSEITWLADSFSGSVFGENGQIVVLGWVSRNKGRAKEYLVSCKECSKDDELFRGGFFKSPKSDLIRGQIPCGCSKTFKCDEEQYTVRVKRVCQTHENIKFLGWHGDFKRGNTKLHLECNIHGSWSTTKIGNFLQGNRGCPRCGNLGTISKMVAINTKSDEDMVTSFMASGAFHPNTEFWRSSRETKRGTKVYWNMKCPKCKDVGVSQQGHFQHGKFSCYCKSRVPDKAYILLVKEYDNVVGVKYGITSNFEGRLRTLNYSNHYDLVPYKMFKFKDSTLCRQAEMSCKLLPFLDLDKMMMVDGWSEVTYPRYLDEIEVIYHKFGGVEVL